MKYLKYSIALIGALALSMGTSYAASFHTLESAKVAKPPTINGNGQDTVWKKAKKLVVEAEDGPEITIKSVHTDKEIFFLLAWEDETESISHNQWVHDGSGWTIKQEVFRKAWRCSARSSVLNARRIQN